MVEIVKGMGNSYQVSAISCQEKNEGFSGFSPPAIHANPVKD